jgi:citrate lyase subunit beta / citryl-CoA lyase
MRSLLFVPAHDARKLAKGLDCGADALIVDLEDAVPEAHKSAARVACAEFVQAHHNQIPIIVRINAFSTGHLLDDLAAIVRAQPFGVMLPKCTQGQDVAQLDAFLSALEVRDGVAKGSIRILPIVTETAFSLFNLSSYMPSCTRLHSMLWGGEDLAADIGAMANRDEQGQYTAPYQLARTLTLLSATTAEVAAIDAVYTNFRDAEGLRKESTIAVRDGFSGKAAIHPDQVAVINQIFTPDPQAVEWATRVIEAFDADPLAGAISLEGKMLDRPHYRSAKRVLARVKK